MTRSSQIHRKKVAVQRSYGQRLGFVGRTAGSPLLSLLASNRRSNSKSREIAEPRKLLPYLLQPNISLLSAETIGAYLQAAIKLFGTWSTGLSQDWDSGKIQDAIEVVDTLVSRFKGFTSHSEIEVQERVSPRGYLTISCLLNATFRPQMRWSSSLSFKPISNLFTSKSRLLAP